MSITTGKKVLVPLATLLAAGAVAVGSGATFSSQSNNSISAVTSGTLQQTNSRDGQAIFSLSDMKPGDTLNGDLTITNTGSLPAAFSLTETTSSNEFANDYLRLTITNTTTGGDPIYTGTFGGLQDGLENQLGTVAPGAANKYRFTVYLDKDAPNDQQGKKATAAYRWSSIQLSGEVRN